MVSRGMEKHSCDCPRACRVHEVGFGLQFRAEEVLKGKRCWHLSVTLKLNSLGFPLALRCLCGVQRLLCFPHGPTNTGGQKSLPTAWPKLLQLGHALAGSQHPGFGFMASPYRENLGAG